MEFEFAEEEEDCVEAGDPKVRGRARMRSVLACSWLFTG